jgi:beta-galactosidase
MLTVGYTNRALTLDGREFFLYSGEFHYFRTDREQWEDSLNKLAAAGCNALFTYVPWNWHEITEGEFDWTGRTHPKRDLLTFLALADAANLRVVVRPGPYITSEWLNGGLPNWLYESYPEISALDASGAAYPPGVSYRPVTYVHPVYEERVRRWYKAFLEVVRPFSAALGGPVIGVQLDDEPAYFQFLRQGPTVLDFNPVMVGDSSGLGFFQRFLERQYGDIAALNERYGSSFPRFEDVRAPRTLPGHYSDLPLYLDWYTCKLEAIADHLKHLHDWVAAAELGVPIYLLFPFHTLQAASRFPAMARARDIQVVTGCESYLGIYGVAAMHEDHVGTIAGIHEIYKTWSLEAGTPALNFETQASHGYHLPAGATEAQVALEVGHGINGISFYMFAGGNNPTGYTEVIGASYDINAPIGAKGELREHYHVLARTGHAIASCAHELIPTTTLQDMTIGFYPPYEATSYSGSGLDYGLRDDYYDVLQNYFGVYYHERRGPNLYALLGLTGINFDCASLETATVDRLLQTSQLWVLGLDFMARDVQERLAEYVRRGGNLVILPRIPELDESLRPCTILSDLVGAKRLSNRKGTKFGRMTPYHHLRTDSTEDLVIRDYVDMFDVPDDARVLAVDPATERPAAFRRQLGQGSVTMVGFKLHYAWDARLDHKAFVDTIFRLNGGRRVASAEGWELVVRERADEDRAFLFVVNPQPTPRTARVTFRDPRTAEDMTIPRVTDGIALPDQGALILSVHRAVADGVELLYSTSQIQAIARVGRGVRIDVYGHPRTTGEAAFVGLPQDAEIAAHGVGLAISRSDGLAIVTYEHGDDGRVELSLDDLSGAARPLEAAGRAKGGD